MRRLAISLLVVIASYPLYSQDRAIGPMHCIGGSARDGFYDGVRLDDGTFVFAGSAGMDSLPTSRKIKAWIVKYDRHGRRLWEHFLGGPGANHTGTIMSTRDGGFLLMGNTEGGGIVPRSYGRFDAWVLRLDSNGNVLWNTTLGGSADDVANEAVESETGDLFVCGYSSSFDGMNEGRNPSGYARGWIARFSGNGQLIWYFLNEGSSDDFIASLALGPNGNIHFVGSGSSPEIPGYHPKAWDVWHGVVSSAGEMITQRCIGGTGNDAGYALELLPDGREIIAGMTASTDGDLPPTRGGEDGFVMTLRSDGSLIRTHLYGGEANEGLGNLFRASNGDLYFGGHSNSKGGDLSTNRGSTDAWLLHLDSTGAIIASLSGGGSKSDHAGVFLPSGSGGYVAAGYSKSPDGDLSGHHGSDDAWVSGLDVTSSILCINASRGDGRLRIETAGASTIITAHGAALPMRLAITDLSGCAVASRELTSERTIIHHAEYPSGVYVVTGVDANGTVSSGRLFVAR